MSQHPHGHQAPAASTAAAALGPMSTDDIKNFPDPGPRGNISQGGGAFLRHPEGPTDTRRHRVPKYAGHRPFENVRPRSARRGGSDHFDRQPHVKGSTYVVPGYTGFVPGAQETLGQTACLLPSPSCEWLDARQAPKKYENANQYRSEVGGIVPGYKGHVPGALRTIGASNYGALMTRELPDRFRWAQGRSKSPFMPPQQPAALEPTMTQSVSSPFLFEKQGLTEQQQQPLSAVELHAQAIFQRNGGTVPRHAALAAAQAAAKGITVREHFAAKLANETKIAEQRLKTRSNTVRQGVLPGYNGHMPRSRESVSRSAFREEGLNSLQVGRKQFRDLRIADGIEKPASRPQSARGPRPGEVVQVM